MRIIITVLFMSLLISCNQAGDKAGNQKETTAISQEIKLFRFGPVENEKPGIEFPDGKRIDVSGFGEDYNQEFFEKDGVTRLRTWLSENVADCPEVAATERIAPCISRPSKIVAIGLNYREHVNEGTSQQVVQVIPKEPVVFFKATTAMCGPYDNAIVPPNSKKMDWEVELAVVIGKKASYVSEADAMNYVAGYTILNDYSEREWQLERDGNQWDKGKSADTFAPVGPFLMLPENLPNPQELDLWLSVNGTMMQKANTRDMIFSIPNLISYVSRHMTLLPGDIISTGTPAGVGNAQKPPLFLKAGDVVELGVQNLGTQKQNVVAFGRID